MAAPIASCSADVGARIRFGHAGGHACLCQGGQRVDGAARAGWALEHVVGVGGGHGRVVGVDGGRGRGRVTGLDGAIRRRRACEAVVDRLYLPSAPVALDAGSPLSQASLPFRSRQTMTF